MVIPAMDIIDGMFAMTMEAPDMFCLAIYAALAVGSKTLNKYYNKTDNSEVYHISMGAFLFWLSTSLLTDILLVLYPQHKLEYFKKNGWRDSWIKAAYDIICAKFNRSYASMNTVLEGDDTEASLDNNVSPFYVLPSNLHALLMTLFKDAIYGIWTQQLFQQSPGHHDLFIRRSWWTWLLPCHRHGEREGCPHVVAWEACYFSSPFSYSSGLSLNPR